MDGHTDSSGAAEAGTSPLSASAHPADQRRRTHWIRRYRRGLLLLAAAAAAAFVFAPSVAARYLQTSGIQLSTAEGDRFRVQIGSARLGWLSPVRLEDVLILDCDNAELLRTSRVSSARSLLSILASPRNPGRFFVERPDVKVVLRPDGSNLQDLLRALSGGEGTASRMHIDVAVAEGTVRVEDLEGRTRLQMDKIECAMGLRQDQDRDIDLEWESVAAWESERTPIECALRWRGPIDQLPFLSGRGSAAVTSGAIPLLALQQQLRTILPTLVVRSGTVSGRLLVEADFSRADALQVRGNLLSENVDASYAGADAQARDLHWPREEVSVAIDGAFDSDAQAVRLTRCALESAPVNLAASGEIDDLQGCCNVNIEGELMYDLAGLIQSLPATVHSQIRVEGLQTRRLKIVGPLARVKDDRQMWDLSDVVIEADLAWESAEAFGVNSQEASLLARWQPGHLQLKPQSLPVSGGFFRAEPEVHWGLMPARVTAAPGVALENVQISKEMCRSWLKYLSPVLADATRAEGHFSVQLQVLQLPAENLAAGDIQGVLQVHSAEVRPGPFANQIIRVVETIRSLVDRGRTGRLAERALVQIPEQQVPFAMIDGRVQHAQLQFLIAGASVRTSGSVGLDDSLDLRLEIPLPESWFRQRVVAEALGGETLVIPVGGTFQNPKFELSSVRDLTRRLTLKATGGLLQKLLE